MTPLRVTPCLVTFLAIRPPESPILQGWNVNDWYSVHSTSWDHQRLPLDPQDPNYPTIGSPGGRGFKKPQSLALSIWKLKLQSRITIHVDSEMPPLLMMSQSDFKCDLKLDKPEFDAKVVEFIEAQCWAYKMAVLACFQGLAKVAWECFARNEPKWLGNDWELMREQVTSKKNFFYCLQVTEIWCREQTTFKSLGQRMSCMPIHGLI